MDDDSELAYWLALRRAGLGSTNFSLLLARFSSIGEAWKAPLDAIAAAGLDAQYVRGVAKARARFDPDTELCTDSPGGDSGACLGDSGSPQIAKEGGAWVLLGATSRGPVPCGTKPSVYTDVVAHADWIDETLKGATH